MKALFARIWRRLDRDLEAGFRILPLLPCILLIASAWALHFFNAPRMIENLIGIPILMLAAAWAIYVKGREWVWRLRTFGHGKFRSDASRIDARACPDCAWDLPEDFDTSWAAMNECPHCGAMLDRSGHLL